MSKYNRNIIGTLPDGEPASVQVDVYSVLNAFEVTCPVMQHIVKKALCTGLRGHKSKTQDLIDIKDSALRALDIERHGNKAQRELHRQQVGHLHSLTVPGSISDARHTLTPHVHECSGGQHRQSLVVPSGPMHRPETMDGHHIHPPIGGLTVNLTELERAIINAREKIDLARRSGRYHREQESAAFDAIEALAKAGWGVKALVLIQMMQDKDSGREPKECSKSRAKMAKFEQELAHAPASLAHLSVVRKYLGFEMHKP